MLQNASFLANFAGVLNKNAGAKEEEGVEPISTQGTVASAGVVAVGLIVSLVSPSRTIASAGVVAVGVVVAGAVTLIAGRSVGLSVTHIAAVVASLIATLIVGLIVSRVSPIRTIVRPRFASIAV